MLFKMNKNTSLALMQLIVAAFILMAPSVLGILPVNIVTYLTFAVFGLLFLLRVSVKDSVQFNPYHIATVILLGYTLLGSLWAGNREGQQVYFFALGATAFFGCIAGDYFAENSTDSIKRRMMYMLSFSGFLCALLNISYWFMYIVPVAGNDAFRQGLSTKDFLSVFIGICIIITFYLIKDNSKFRRALLITNSVLMIFVFVMAKSIVGWSFVIILAILFLLKKRIKSEKSFALISLGSVIVFCAMVICAMSISGKLSVFGDVFFYGIKNPFGFGGGFWSGKEIFSAGSNSLVMETGLLPFFVAASGVVGLVCCISIIVRNLIVFLRLKTWESLIALLICATVMLLPFGENLIVVLFWIALCTYNESYMGKGFKLQCRRLSEKVIFVISVSVIISVFLFFVSFIRIGAENAYKNKDYDEAFNLYKISGILNPADSESCRMAASSMRKLERIPQERDTAIELVDKAIKRDRHNLSNLREKALIYDACEEYSLSAMQYREITQRAISKDEYNRLLAKELYKIVKNFPKGSSETKRAYEEIVSIAQSTDNLELRKEINDIADKALLYTKGELGNEGIGK